MAPAPARQTSGKVPRYKSPGPPCDGKTSRVAGFYAALGRAAAPRPWQTSAPLFSATSPFTSANRRPAAAHHRPIAGSQDAAPARRHAGRPAQQSRAHATPHARFAHGGKPPPPRSARAPGGWRSAPPKRGAHPCRPCGGAPKSPPRSLPALPGRRLPAPRRSVRPDRPRPAEAPGTRQPSVIRFRIAAVASHRRVFSGSGRSSMDSGR